MKTIVLAAAALFLAAISFIEAAARIEASRRDERDERSSAALPNVSADELAGHGSRGDCWIAVHGEVYDVTGYIDRHPAPPATIVEACGTNATVAFDTKGRGRPHSQHARELLRTMHVGSYAR